MGFVLPSGVVNTDSVYFFVADVPAPLGPLVKQPSDQTLVIIDYSTLLSPIVINNYTFTVDVSSNPELVVSYPQLNATDNVLTFLLSGGIAGQQYNLSIVAQATYGVTNTLTANGAFTAGYYGIPVPPNPGWVVDGMAVTNLTTSQNLGTVQSYGILNIAQEAGVFLLWGKHPLA